jgi:gamma-glutamylcyclotransferase (GGCT)/AIG2-like uncharacterized protein YtfP
MVNDMGAINPQQLFIYSSLRKGFHQDVFKYISHLFSFEGTAKTKGILNIINNEPVATPSQGRFIKGELYKLKKQEDFSWVFGQLDDYEGLIVEPGEEPLYKRALTTVYKDDGTITKAWIYWYNGNVKDSPVISSGDIFYNPGQKNI